MKKIFLILIFVLSYLTNSFGQNINNNTPGLNSLGMIKLYKTIDNKLHYWETWETDAKTGIIHWGEVGTKGQDKEIKSGFLEKFSNKIRKEMNKKLEEGYYEFSEENYSYLEIEYKIDGFGTKQDLDKRHKLEEKMNEVLAWTGLGNTDGGSIGNGSMEIGCLVVDFEIAKRLIVEKLKNTEFENYSRIYNMDAE